MANKRSGLDPEVVEYFADKVENPADFFSEDRLFKHLKKALTEWILEGELTMKIGYEMHDDLKDNSGNLLNGYSEKARKQKKEN